MEHVALQALVERQREEWNLEQLSGHGKQYSNGSNANLTDQAQNGRGSGKEERR